MKAERNDNTAAQSSKLKVTTTPYYTNFDSTLSFELTFSFDISADVMKKPFALLVNPPIYDFAAYDLWLKPLGLLYIGAILKNVGIDVGLLDCLDRSVPGVGDGDSNRYGCGRFHSVEIEKPEILKNIPRIYRRFGMPGEAIEQRLSSFRPDIILVTSVMTYWYPGVNEIIRTLRQIYPGTPIVLGGTYASLCEEHARKYSGADFVVPGRGLDHLASILKKTGVMHEGESFPTVFSGFPPPLYELYNECDYVSIRTSMGCPFRCSYCAIGKTAPVYERKDSAQVASEIENFSSKGILDFAFYDDALLVDGVDYLSRLAQDLNRTGREPRFHTPNGLHARYLTGELAHLMKKVNFILPRLSLETASAERQRASGGKVSNENFSSACHNLCQAGYDKGDYAAYILLGMPGQSFEEVEETIRFAHGEGAKVLLTEYSPIPGTADWEKIKDGLPSDDPLWHNNSIFPLYPLSAWPRFQNLKDLAHELNRQLKAERERQLKAQR